MTTQAPQTLDHDQFQSAVKAARDRFAMLKAKHPMGIHARHSATFAANEDDLQASNDVFAKKISASRKASMMCRLNEQEAATLRESMEETLDKSRKEKK